MESCETPAANTAHSDSTDKLAEVLARGTLIVSTDPAYLPQSELVEGTQRIPNTKCASDQRTASELAGFDIEVSKEVARRLGVEVCFAFPDGETLLQPALLHQMHADGALSKLSQQFYGIDLTSPAVKFGLKALKQW